LISGQKEVIILFNPQNAFDNEDFRLQGMLRKNYITRTD
jgi:hypothetical protein